MAYPMDDITNHPAGEFGSTFRGVPRIERCLELKRFWRMESSNKNSEIIRLPGPTKRWGAKCFFQSILYIYIYNCNVGMIYAWTFILGASDGFPLQGVNSSSFRVSLGLRLEGVGRLKHIKTYLNMEYVEVTVYLLGWVVVSNMFYFHPYLESIFFRWVGSTTN